MIVAKRVSLFNMYSKLCEVNGLPKLNTATNTDLISLSIILYYVFSSNNHEYQVCISFTSIKP